MLIERWFIIISLVVSLLPHSMAQHPRGTTVDIHLSFFFWGLRNMEVQRIILVLSFLRKRQFFIAAFHRLGRSRKLVEDITIALSC